MGRRLLETELRELDGPPDGGGKSAVARDQPAAGQVPLAAAAERALQKLDRPLSRLVGAEGYRALLRRALHLAMGEHPYLRNVELLGVHAGTRPAPLSSPEEPGTPVTGVGPDRPGDALATVLIHVLGLLVTFIGSDLTARTVRDVWPDLPTMADGTGHADAAAGPAAAEYPGGEIGAASGETAS